MRLAIVCVGLFVLGACSGADEPSSTSSSAVAQVSTDGEPTEHRGKQTYQNYCFSCHTPGLSGAPKLGDVEGWKARIAKGEALLLQSTVEGMPPAMPARGMCFSCSDQELADAIDYMIAESQ